jgi:hypothetical protein
LGIQGLNDCSERTVDVLEDVIVPETQCAKAVLSEPRVASAIRSALGVLTTIELDDQLRIQTSKVCGVRANGTLLAEIASMQLSTPQTLPQKKLGVCQLCAQFPRAL